MLFLVDAAGVPSVARMVTVGVARRRRRRPRLRRTCAPSVAITAPANSATFAWKSTIDVDSDGVGHRRDRRPRRVPPQRVEVAEDLTAPYAWRWKSANPGSHTVAARAVDNAGASATATVTITVRPK